VILKQRIQGRNAFRSYECKENYTFIQTCPRKGGESRGKQPRLESKVLNTE